MVRKGKSASMLTVSAPLLYALWQAEHAMRLEVDKALDELNLSLPHFATLSLLAQRPGQSTADLARFNQVSPQNMGMAVSRLSSLGYIRRQDPVRGRIAELYLTERGRQVLAKAQTRVAAVERRAFKALNAGEQKSLPTTLRKLRESVADQNGRVSASLQASKGK